MKTRLLPASFIAAMILVAGATALLSCNDAEKSFEPPESPDCPTPIGKLYPGFPVKMKDLSTAGTTTCLNTLEKRRAANAKVEMAQEKLNALAMDKNSSAKSITAAQAEYTDVYARKMDADEAMYLFYDVVDTQYKELQEKQSLEPAAESAYDTWKSVAEKSKAPTFDRDLLRRLDERVEQKSQ